MQRVDLLCTHPTTKTSLGRDGPLRKKKPRQAVVANGSRGSQGGSEESHTVLGGYAARSALLEGSPTVNIFSIASDNPPKDSTDLETESGKGHGDLLFRPTNCAPLSRSPWDHILSTSSTTKQHPQHIIFSFGLFVCACTCMCCMCMCTIHM